MTGEMARPSRPDHIADTRHYGQVGVAICRLVSLHGRPNAKSRKRVQAFAPAVARESPSFCATLSIIASLYALSVYSREGIHHGDAEARSRVQGSGEKSSP